MESKKVYDIEFNEFEFKALMEDYAKKVRNCQAKFNIKSGYKKTKSESEIVMPSFYYELFLPGQSKPVIYQVSENEVKDILRVIFDRYAVLDIELKNQTDKKYNNLAANIPTSGPNPLTQEQMRICRHPEMYRYFEITSSFTGAKVTFMEKEKQVNDEILTEKVLEKKMVQN